MSVRRGRARALALPALVLLAASPPGERPAPGAYCPFPEEGEMPACLRGAQGRYAEFFSGLEDGHLSDAEAARVEADVGLGARAAGRYEAISSLAYGYYRLSQRAAAAGSLDPAVAARLERWNELLAAAYGGSGGDASYRAAVREAAFDLQRRAPPVRLSCRDAAGGPSPCDSTDAVVRGMLEARDRTGPRGALARLLERLGGLAGGCA